MRRQLAVFLISIFLSACATGGITPRAREIQALRGEVKVLQGRAEALEAALVEAQEKQRNALDARESALRSELVSLQNQLTTLLAALAEQQAEQIAVIAGNGGDAGTSKAGSSSAAPRARAPRRKSDPEQPEETLQPMSDPAERVRALMADVAARLQVASETVDEDDSTAATRLGRARQLLVDADRAASKKDYAQAETLAQDAAEMIADTVAAAGTTQR